MEGAKVKERSSQGKTNGLLCAVVKDVTQRDKEAFFVAKFSSWLC